MHRSFNNTYAVKYEYNRKSMQAIDTESKAYLLGWLATDGYIGNDSVVLSLKDTDSHVIQNMFNNVFGINIPPIKYRTDKRDNTKLASISMYSQELVNDIKHHLKLQSTDKKTFTVSMPELANDKLRWAFLRGVFEGDGTIDSLYTKTALRLPSGGGLKVRICSASPKFLSELQLFMTKYNITSSILNKKEKRYPNSKLQTLEISSRYAIVALRQLYPLNILPSHRLDRKYEIAIEWIRRFDEISNIAAIQFSGSRMLASKKFNIDFKRNNKQLYS